MTANYIGLQARKWIRDQLLTGSLGVGPDLNEEFLIHVEAAMESHRRGNFSPLVYLVCKELGASKELSENVAVGGHLFYVAVGVVDDIQDEDADYLPMQISQRINVALAIRELSARKLLEVLPRRDALAAQLTAATVRMCIAQSEELARESNPWDLCTYERVARGTAGAELGFLLYLAGSANGTFEEDLRAVGEELGVLFQVDVDLATTDPRISGFTQSSIAVFRGQVYATLCEQMSVLPLGIQGIFKRAIGKVGSNGKESKDYDY